jgi:predicted NAD-dependent protein-ADP-ribosyltransferase YbiA (DUF1768 family)
MQSNLKLPWPKLPEIREQPPDLTGTIGAQSSKKYAEQWTSFMRAKAQFEALQAMLDEKVRVAEALVATGDCQLVPRRRP